MFLSKLEKGLFEDRNFSHFHRQKFGREEWKVLKYLAEEKSIVIKSADKISCVVIWDRENYVKKADRQLSDNKVYMDVKYTKNMFSSLVDKSNKIFQSLPKKKYRSKYFTYNVKNATNLGKLYFLLKIHKRLFNAPGRPVTSNCGNPTKKFSEYLNFCLKPIMQNGWSDVKDSSDFKNKIKKLGKLSSNITLVTADVVALYPSIPTTKRETC